MNVLNNTEVQSAKLDVDQVDAVEETLLLEDDDGAELLQLEEGLDVKDLDVEQVLEAAELEVLGLAQLVEEVEVDGVE